MSLSLASKAVKCWLWRFTVLEILAVTRILSVSRTKAELQVRGRSDWVSNKSLCIGRLTGSDGISNFPSHAKCHVPHVDEVAHTWPCPMLNQSECRQGLTQVPGTRGDSIKISRIYNCNLHPTTTAQTEAAQSLWEPAMAWHDMEVHMACDRTILYQHSSSFSRMTSYGAEMISLHAPGQLNAVSTILFRSNYKERPVKRKVWNIYRLQTSRWEWMLSPNHSVTICSLGTNNYISRYQDNTKILLSYPLALSGLTSTLYLLIEHVDNDLFVSRLKFYHNY